MKSRLILLALMATIVSSCSLSDADKQDANKKHRFFAVLEQPSSVDTKVYADENLKLLWNAKDCIAIFDKTAFGEKYEYTGEDGSNAGYFEYFDFIDEGGFYFGNDIDIVCAVYPYDDRLKIDNASTPVTLTLPASQVYLDNSFGKGANTMISVGEDHKLSFKNLCGYLAFKIYGDDVNVSSVTLKGNNNESLAGRAEINVALDKDPSLKAYTKGTDSITLDCSDPVKIGDTAENATIFWMVVPPTVFSKGFTVTVKDTAGKEFVKTLSRSFEVKRNTSVRMAAFKAVME